MLFFGCFLGGISKGNEPEIPKFFLYMNSFLKRKQLITDYILLILFKTKLPMGFRPPLVLPHTRLTRRPTHGRVLSDLASGSELSGGQSEPTATCNKYTVSLKNVQKRKTLCKKIPTSVPRPSGNPPLLGTSQRLHNAGAFCARLVDVLGEPALVTITLKPILVLLAWSTNGAYGAPETA